jgi:hypothetical protein
MSKMLEAYEALKSPFNSDAMIPYSCNKLGEQCEQINCPSFIVLIMTIAIHTLNKNTTMKDLEVVTNEIAAIVNNTTEQKKVRYKNY